MPQLYVETDYNDLKIKWGHFYTIIGYEVVPAIGNFFYTHAYTHMYGEPFTHTGILASRPYNENWTWYAGIDNGWNAFDCNSRANFLGGVTYADKDWGSLAFAIQTGDESDFNAPGVGPFSNRTMYSLVWTRTLNSRWTYVFEHDLGVQAETQGFNAANRQQADWYGINQYLFYRINCCWTFGWRFEWFDDPQGYMVTGLRPGNNDAPVPLPRQLLRNVVGLQLQTECKHHHSARNPLRLVHWTRRIPCPRGSRSAAESTLQRQLRQESVPDRYRWHRAILVDRHGRRFS